MPASITYRWQSSTDGTTWTDLAATTSSLTLDSSLVGNRIRTNATYTDLLGTSESVTSAATALVAGSNNHPGVVSVSGTPTQNQILTATVSDADGVPASVTYQWQQSSNGTTWSNINGATASTLTLAQAQVGSFVRATATYTDILGSSENAGERRRPSQQWPMSTTPAPSRSAAQQPRTRF